MLDKPCIIAVCGKGGVGKTSISAMIVRALLRHPENRILAIDADPAVGLAAALGVDAARTVDDVRNDLISRMEGGGGADKAEMLAMLDYDMLSVLEESKNLAFLAIGRPEKEGCYCRINQLLREEASSILPIARQAKPFGCAWKNYKTSKTRSNAKRLNARYGVQNGGLGQKQPVGSDF